MQPLDDLDKRILNLLQQDNSIPLKLLAEKVYSSVSTCQRRIQTMIDNNVISKQVAIINPSAVGKNISVFVMIEMETHNPKQQFFEQKMLEEPEVMSCYEISGDYDFLLLVHTENMQTYHEFTRRVLTSENNVRSYKSQFIMNFSKVGTKIDL
ncbi:Lrp/AsnC family transcriptional regulator [Psittacicella gerlachiana]|uniref:AsnC family transcriptional regulator n=1 Tax=Psittacicella gerlachiana TaxID=2028574 RepID=A0A3A1YBL5_9GAMM|nr:Lrp/AsnC family transcriptional regulator [Psittacicella gerlachiana]RIY34756.1 AsnC family transcriptional regulator [Psittacicella gerlachiana]